MTGFVLSGLVLASLGDARAATVDRIAATVNREVITLSQVYELAGDYIDQAGAAEAGDGPERRAAELQVLDELIRRELVAQEVERLGLTVTEEELQRSLDDVASQNGMTREQLQQEVERSGLTWPSYLEEFRESLQDIKFTQSVILPRIAVTDDEVIDLYNRRVKELAGTGGGREVQGILIPWGDADDAERVRIARRASAIRARVEAGEDWAAVVAEFPQSPYATDGGAMGQFRAGELVPEVDAVVFGLPVGGVSDPLTVGNGLLVVRVASEQASVAPTLEELRGQLQGELRQQKVEQEVELWATQARRRAAVDVKLASP